MSLRGYLESSRATPDQHAALEELARLEQVAIEARALYERVEMDESVGTCLSDRVPSLRLGAALAALGWPQ